MGMMKRGKMMKKIMAVYDADSRYADRLAEFVNQRSQVPFQVVAFTSLEKLKEFAAREKIDLLLAGSGVEKEQLDGIPAAQVVWLSENGVAEEGEAVVYKYQASDDLLREVMSWYRPQEIPVLMTAAGRRSRITGVYSPIGRCGKTSFALTLGQILAKKRACLYLNLEAYSGFEYLMERKFEQTLGDLLYYLRLGSDQLVTKMGSMVQSINNLDYLPPVLSMEDIQSTTAEEWIRLLQQIIDYSNYDVIILDLGDSVSQLYQLLEQCTRIYMPIRADPVSQAKIQQFEHTLQVWEKQAVLDRIRKIKPPYHRSTRSGTGYMDDLVWSELGDYVREMIRKEWEDG